MYSNLYLQKPDYPLIYYPSTPSIEKFAIKYSELRDTIKKLDESLATPRIIGRISYLVVNQTIVRM